MLFMLLMMMMLIRGVEEAICVGSGSCRGRKRRRVPEEEGEIQQEQQ